MAVHTPTQAVMGMPKRNLRWPYAKQCSVFDTERLVCNMSYGVWTPWFKGIAWDVTATIFDRGNRKLWMFVTTDTD
jgi:hypothetical protein